MNDNGVGCIVVDDELQNRETLSKMIEQFCPMLRIEGKAGCVKDAAELIQNKKPSIVFLDIEMPGGSGFTLFDLIKNPDFLVIFTTAHADYAIKAIKFAALDYLLKPLNPLELKSAVENAINRVFQRDEKLRASGKEQIKILRDSYADVKNIEKIAIPTGDGIQLLELKNIIRCEADRAYCTFHLVDGTKYMVSKSLKEFESILESADFFRVHKSNMINLFHVQKYVRGKGGQAIMSNGISVPVATRRKDMFLEAIVKR